MNKRLYPISEEYFQETYPSLSDRMQGWQREASSDKRLYFFCAIVFIMRTGVSWRDLPEVYGSWHTIYTRFKRWSESGWFWKLLQKLQTKKLVSVEFTWIDSTTIAIHRHGSGALKKGNQLIGKCRKGLSTKIHLALSTGDIQSSCLSEGQRVDMKAFSELWALGQWAGFST